MENYTIGKVMPPNVEDALASYNPFLRELLFHRGIETADAAERFLSPDFLLHTHDPFLMKDMEKAVLRLLKAIKDHEKIVIFSDYDADGIPGAVVAHDFFRKIGY